MILCPKYKRIKHWSSFASRLNHRWACFTIPHASFASFVVRSFFFSSLLCISLSSFSVFFFNFIFSWCMAIEPVGFASHLLLVESKWLESLGFYTNDSFVFVFVFWLLRSLNINLRRVQNPQSSDSPQWTILNTYDGWLHLWMPSNTYYVW